MAWTVSVYFINEVLLLEDLDILEHIKRRFKACRRFNYEQVVFRLSNLYNNFTRWTISQSRPGSVSPYDSWQEGEGAFFPKVPKFFFNSNFSYVQTGFYFGGDDSYCVKL